MQLSFIATPDAFNRPGLLERDSYRRLRIPGIAAAAGNLYLYYECRRGGDWSAIDVGLQKSADGGRTWSPARILISGKGRAAINNPYMIPDGDTLHFLYCENYKRLFYVRSGDGGETWSTPRELTDRIDAGTAGEFWSVLAVGPGHGIRTAAGTLAAPMWFGVNREDIFSHHPSVIRVLTSPDGGGSWALSPVIGGGLPDPSECAIAQAADGTLLLNVRSETPEKLRAWAQSADDGRTWGDARTDPALPDPCCCAGLCAAEDGLLFSNCDSRDARENLTVRFLRNGRTEARLRVSAAAGYSDICYDPTRKTAFVAYENESSILRVAAIRL